jgi:N-methylhydantoinase A
MSCKPESANRLLGVDTGGTFTDFVYCDDQGVRFHKVLSTPAAPELAILQGIQELGIVADGLRIIHGSTVATNAVLQNRGARTAYISNRGLQDVLTIGRQARSELYELQPQKPLPPVPPELCLQTNGRRGADGNVIDALEEADIKALLAELDKLKPEAVAINLLFAFINGEDEARIANALPAGLFVSCSHRVLPEYREYERGIATWLNASVGPLVQGYLQRFEAGVQPARVSIMRSSGQTCAAEQAGEEAVHLLLSGPAGGLAAARFIGRQTGEQRLLSFDMGGTSTDVAMVDGEIALTSRGRIGRYPVGVPMVDLHTIGAGGGSIAHADAGGGLVVGPESAGADPGPACYGRGGRSPTVTDANLVLGRLPETARLGGTLALDRSAAVAAMEELAAALKLPDAAAAAEGVIRLVNENMARALRVISVQRGVDPREFALLAFGGAGGLHICALADALHISRALVPDRSGVLSALGMLVAPDGRQLSRTLAGLLDEYTDSDLDRLFSELEEQGREILAGEGIEPDSIQAGHSLDLCYRGQTSTLNLVRAPVRTLAERFHALHAQRFGHRLQSPVELVNVRVSVNAKAHVINLPERKHTGTPEPVDQQQVSGCKAPVPIYDRHALPVELEIDAPAIIVDAVSTTFIDTGWRGRLDAYANLLLTRTAGDAT